MRREKDGNLNVTRAQGGEVRTRILESATRAFATRGFEGASLQSIAEAVGIRKASLLYHFESKEALHQKVLSEQLSRWNETVPRLLRAAAREERLDALLNETLDFFLTDPNRARLLLREALDRPRRMRELLVSHASSWISLVADAIRKEQEAGEVRRDVDPEAWLLNVIHLVVTSVASFSTTGVILGEAGQSESTRPVKELVRLIKASLLTPSAATAPQKP